MLKFEQFDLKTGKTLTAYDPNTQGQVTRYKQAEHSYLEHWLGKHGLTAEAKLYVANFYEGVTDRDRQRQEERHRILVFTNGKKGYFTDPDTANLIVNGDAERSIAPIYAANQDAAHNLVAYGSLVSSDGLASTVRSDVRILLIDDETGNSGEPIVDWSGEPLPPEDVTRILDKMGDGTMLVSSDLMQGLRVAGETDLTTTVTQFRAATPDFPGIAKGTAGVSAWCEYLGVDAIVSQNDIKGDDGRFATPGIKELTEFWVNRKSDAECGWQSVGPQVKGCLPVATIGEFNPEMLQKGEALAAIANDPIALAQKYIAAKTRPKSPEVDDAVLDDGQVDAVAQLLQADPHGVLIGFERVNRAMETFLRHQRVDLATHGIEVPSAMAQHHNALKPWEVANRDLPQGAIVAYYRSPFANVGSAAIGINNPAAIYWADDEAYQKTGVAYLHPWTAKQVAVTDFDRDTNGYFVGFVPESDLAGRKLTQTLRDQLAAIADQSPVAQYEAGRAAIAALIETAQVNPGQYPQAVTEMITLNAPEHRPPEIIKAPKVKHDWQMDAEPASQAIWRAWAITANNPTGRVANAAMNLRSLAMETQYVPDDQAIQLLQSISTHYQGLVKDQQRGQLVVPTDQELGARGYPAYGLADRMQQIAQAGVELTKITQPTDRLSFAREQLGVVQQLLTDFVDGPQAENLQTAVDVAKSQRGIDEDVQHLARALAYKEHALRQHQKDPTIYKDGKVMPTNTDEPIGWGVEQANALYDDSRLMENPHGVYYGLLPNIADEAQQRTAQAIGDGFNALQRQGVAEKIVDKLAPVNQQPTVTIRSSQGNQLMIQRTLDVPDHERSPLWDSQDGLQPDWQIIITHNPVSQAHPEPYKAFLQVAGETRRWPIGYIAENGVQDREGAKFELSKKMVGKADLSIANPVVVLNPPLVEQPPARDSFAQAREFLTTQVAALPPAERPVIAGYLWHHAQYNSAAIAGFQSEISDALAAAQLPTLKIIGLQHNLDLTTFDPHQEYQFQLIGTMGESKRAKSPGGNETVPIEKMMVYRVGTEGALSPVGMIPDTDLRLPSQTLVTGRLELRDDTKRAFELHGQRVVIKDVDLYDAKHRIFDEHPIMLRFAMGVAKHLLVQFEDQGQVQTLGRLNLTAARKLGITPQTELTVAIDNQVQNVHSQVGTLRVSQVLGRQLEPAVMSAPSVEAGFNPSRADLRAWFMAIQQTSSAGANDPRLEMVQGIGKTLNAAYCAEQGLPLPTDKALVETPMDYWHPNVMLTAAQNRDRVMTMTMAQQQKSGAIER